MRLRADLLHRALFFLFNDTATTEIYTLSLHDALPICDGHRDADVDQRRRHRELQRDEHGRPDRKSTRLNSSHPSNSYAVFCLKKKNNSARSSPSERILVLHIPERPPRSHVDWVPLFFV